MIYIILYMIRVILVFKQTEQIKKTKKGVKKGENKRNKGKKITIQINLLNQFYSTSH